MMENIQQLIRRLRNNGIKVSIKNADLEINSFGAPIPEDILNTLRQVKQELIAYLHANAAGSHFEHIAKSADMPDYPLSSSQTRIWVSIQEEGGVSAYNMPGAIEISGSVDVGHFFSAIYDLTDRHEILRTVFRENAGGMVRQVILPANEFNFTPEFIDLRGNADNDTRLKELVEEQANAAFDLRSGPLLSMRLFQTGDARFVFAYSIHHIIGDGWSMDVLARDVMRIYRSYVSGQRAALPPLAIQYKDYAVWQQSQLNSTAMDGHRAFWKENLKGPVPLLDLPSEKVRPVVKTYNGAIIPLFIESPILDRVIMLSKRQDGSTYMVLLAAVNCLLYKYTQQNDFLLGTPVAGRDHADLKDQIGVYVNTAPMRNRVDGKESFAGLFAKVRENVFNAFAHQAYPLDILVDDLKIRRDASRSALFDMMVSYNGPDDSAADHFTDSDLTVSAIGIPFKLAKFDLALKFTELSAGGLRMNIEYNTDIYDEGLLTRFGRHFVNMLTFAVENPDTPIDHIPVLENSDKDFLINGFNKDQGGFPVDETIVSLFERQVELFPSRMALRFGEEVYTYRQLNFTANQLANYLMDRKKVVSGDYVAILLERSEWIIIAMLAILKTGGSFVPMDLENPEDRVDYMKSDSNCAATIDDAMLAGFKAEMVHFSGGNPGKAISPGSSAYLVYTSGSTGLPKGVITMHSSIVNYNNWFANRYDISAQDSSVLLSSIAFSGVYTSVFGTLLNGGALHVVPKVVIHSVEFLSEYIETFGISFLKITPSHLHLLIHYGNFLAKRGNLRLIVIGGDKIRVNDLQYVTERAKDIRVLYHYGASETAMGTLAYEVTSNPDEFMRRPRLGTPVSNVDVYLLDKNHTLVPRGATGEICVGGAGLTPGYLNKEDLNEKYFIKDPFKHGKRLFKTGDFGRMLEDSTIEFLGRTDNQVKVRGYRVEIGEIERALLGSLDISEVVVLPKPLESGENELVCYFVSNVRHDITTLRRFLRLRLPEYMIPSFFIQLDSFPISPTGKLDKDKLPSPENYTFSMGMEYTGPRNEMEERVYSIWSDTLTIQRFSIFESFFEIGGNSLKVTMLTNRFLKDFGIRLYLQDVFANPTVAEQSVLLSPAPSAIYRIIEKAPALPDFPLSNDQFRLWNLCQFREASIALNIPVTYELNGDLRADVLEESIMRLIERHEVLRTVFIENAAGEPRQRILDMASFDLPFQKADLSDRSDSRQLLKDMIQEGAGMPFDLHKGPLIRVSLIKLEDKKYVLAVVLHHILSDAWSMFILMREVAHLYNNISKGRPVELKPLRIQYKDYAFWQQRLLSEGRFEKERAYWLESLSGIISPLPLPVMNPRPALRSFRGDGVSVLFGDELLARLKGAASENDATLFSVLFSVTVLLIYKMTYQDDIIAGAPFAGRQHSDLEDQIGFYLSLLPLRVKVEPHDHFLSILEKVKKVLSGALEHQAYPFDVLLDELVRDGRYRLEKSRNPIFDIVISLHTDHIGSSDDLLLDGIEVDRYREVHSAVSRFDLMFGFADTPSGLYLMLNFNTDIFSREFAEKVCGDLIRLADLCLSQSSMRAEQLLYLPLDSPVMREEAGLEYVRADHGLLPGEEGLSYGFKF